jgi:hypothetical protein
MQFSIKHRFSGAALFACELHDEIAEKSYSLQLGCAVREAVKAGAMLYRASTGRVPHFFASNADAMEDIRRCAEGAT